MSKNETKFTPGPWAIDRMGANGTDIVGSGIHICQVSALQQKIENANAALISAAPEMYEQLVLVQAYLSAKNLSFTGIDAILIKARGES